MGVERVEGEYVVTDDAERVDVAAVHAFLTVSYWAAGISRQTVARSLGHSLCFSVLHRGAQVGFARVISDQATFAYLADVYLLPEHRGRGLGRRLIAFVSDHPELQGLRRWVLATRDAHGLHARFGFTRLSAPYRFLDRLAGSAAPT